jgi:acyl-CoA thioesterase
MNQIETAGMDAQQLAQACSEFIQQRDQAALSLGVTLVEAAPGRATLRMTVRKTMLNGLSSCHGGVMFTLADTAFAHACNSYNRNTVGSGCSIEYAAPGFEGDELTAVAQEIHRSGRTGVYDVTIYNQKQQALAYFRGKSYQVRGAVIAESDATDAAQL